jgi:predicted nucleic acid-binding protein
LGFSNVPAQIIQFTKNAFVIALNDVIATETINLRKKHKIKLPDAVIAATAIVLNLTSVTSNVDDFKNIDGLNILNPQTV